jgi:hypothetical protein
MDELIAALRKKNRPKVLAHIDAVCDNFLILPGSRTADDRAETADGNYNTVVVKDQSVRVEEADCKNQICVKTGAIHFPGEVIACMPHRMMIYIE